ncbi:hypothetical protein SKAU_G00249970 [Synaphobranchus kaupii]|uniref:Uncharacterized protein n=1 Tax=Synaphobranchus kaupii TaxID=118154 RepID=A0A9Q1IRT2_SYNKA|nr:hypothetical protein SKAU_G00249970 [Synaphobranchus kaupii]
MDSQSMRRTHLHSWRWKMRTLLMYFNNRLAAPPKGGHLSVQTVQTSYLENVSSAILFYFSSKCFNFFWVCFLCFVTPPSSLSTHQGGMGFVLNVYVREDRILDGVSDLLFSEQF